MIITTTYGCEVPYTEDEWQRMDLMSKKAAMSNASLNKKAWIDYSKITIYNGSKN